MFRDCVHLPRRPSRQLLSLNLFCWYGSLTKAGYTRQGHLSCPMYRFDGCASHPIYSVFYFILFRTPWYFWLRLSELRAAVFKFHVGINTLPALGILEIMLMVIAHVHRSMSSCHLPAPSGEFSIGRIVHNIHAMIPNSSRRFSSDEAQFERTSCWRHAMPCVLKNSIINYGLISLQGYLFNRANSIQCSWPTQTRKTFVHGESGPWAGRKPRTTRTP